MEYKLVKASIGKGENQIVTVNELFLDIFQNEIQELLNQGWKLHGETKIIHGGRELYCFQAMVKEDGTVAKGEN